MASVAISTALKKITALRVVDLKSELKRRNLDTTGVKSVLLARLKQALESEDADFSSVERQPPVGTSTRKSGKGKGSKIDLDLETTMEDDVPSKETEENESEKDVTDTDDHTRENCKPALTEDNLAQPEPEGETTAEPEVEPETEATIGKADSDPEVRDADTDVEPEVDADAKQEAEADAEWHVNDEAEAEPQVDDEAEAEPQGDDEAEAELQCEDEPEAEPHGDGEAEPEAEPHGDGEAKPEAEPHGDGEAEPEADREAEPELESEEEMATEAMDSLQEAEDDHLSVSMQNEDAITLDVDGDDLLDTGKHVKLPDSEADKGSDEPEASAEMNTDDDMKMEDKDGKQDDGAWGEASKDSREVTKKAEAGDKEKDSGKKGPSSTGVSGQAKSSSRDRDGKAAKDDKVVGSSSSISSSHNVWVSGLSFNTKAADLKNLFGKYGKVLSAKVLTNARSPGSKCYGLVTMSSNTEVTRCISQLDCSELDGQEIYVECAKNYPFKKESSKTELDEKASTGKSSEKRSSTGTKLSNKSQPYQKDDKSGEKEKDLSKDNKSGKCDSGSKSPGSNVEGDETKGKLTFFKTRPFRKTRYFEKPFVPMPMQRRPKWLIPPEELEMIKNKQRFVSKEDGFVPFAKIKEQSMRERMERTRRHREMVEQARRERECEERENLFRERQRLEMERQKLERERFVREKLERERIRIEQERRKEAEHIARQQELRRQQEHLRYEQERRNLKRGRDVEHGRRDNTYWNGNKKIPADAADTRLNQGGNFNRPQNRFSNFNTRPRSRFPQATDEQTNTFDRRNRFTGEPEAKKSRISPPREGASFERYPKNFEAVRRAEPLPSRTDLRDTDRRDRDERRPIQIHDRPMGARISGMSGPRPPRDGGHGWKNNTDMNANKGELRAPMRIRTERSGRDGPGSALRGGSSASRGRGSFSDQDGGRPMVMNNQPFSSGRRVVVQRHSREQGMRKEWQGGSASQGGGSGGGGFSENRRMSNSRGSMMSPPSGHSSGMSRIVQITSSSVSSGGNTGSFKPFKGTRQF
ncbi:SAFB-like transcription modulator isoform X2 [Hippocampus comes]|uniref:SAFB-like transcription modulator isoform X2 n=1 Tax=Hippocampus comes TaxID=109280 RepID=UPI00094F039D|nr:PREDICTED: SAFB-like transcription modulator isoform X2 [Hippocampus comes]